MAVCLRLDSHAALLCSTFAMVVITTFGRPEDLLNNDGQVDPSHYKKIFKLKKYNDIWFRAQVKSVPQEKLRRLEKILYKLDKMELDLKHSDSKNQDEVAKRKSKVEVYLNEILKEYDLLENDVRDQEDVHFQDHRINRLWQDAVDEGRYTKDELRSLHNEMGHMENKIEEVRTFARKTEDLRRTVDDSMENDVRMSENTVEATDAAMLKEAEEMHEELKERKETINKQVKHMEKMVRDKKKLEFSDDRVRRLWVSAQNGTFTAAELQTVKEELSHFQRHIDKLDHWQKINIKLEGKGGTEEALHVQDKISEYKKKVKKYHKTMLKKVKEKIEL